MKRLIALSLAMVMILALAACGTESKPTTSQNTQPSATTMKQNELNRVTVETVPGSSDLAITVLAEYLDETKTQKTYDAEATENGWTEAKLQKDRSVRYVMSDEKRQEEIKKIDENARKFIKDLVPTTVYPNFTSIDANKDFTKFTVHCKTTTDISVKELQIVLDLYAQSGLYNSFNGTAGRSCVVVFFDDSTGKTYRESGMII